MVRGAVIEARLLRQYVREVGGGDEPTAGGLAGARGVEGHAVNHSGHQAGGCHHLLHGTRHHGVQYVEVIGAGRACVQRHEDSREVARHGAGSGTHHGQGVRIALLGHQGACAAVLVSQRGNAKLLAGQDLKVLRHLALVGGGGGRSGHQLQVWVPLPHGVLHMRHHARRTQEFGKARAVERPARPGAAAGARHRQVELGVDGTKALGIAQHRIGVGQNEVAQARGLCRLQIGVIGRKVGGVTIGQTRERRRQINAGVVQVPRGIACHKAKAHAECLAARAPGRQPAGGHVARALLQLMLTAVEGIAQRRVKGELVTGDLIEVEQGDEQCLGLVSGNGLGFGECHHVSQIRGGESIRQTGSGGGLVAVARCDQLICGAALKASAASQVLPRHAREPSGPA